MEALLLSAVLPAVLDMFKGMGGALSRKWFGLGVDDQIKLQNSDIDRIRALAELDNPHGTPTQWVVDLRASFRYVAALLSILLGAYLLMNGMAEYGFDLVSVPFGFIFGERLWMGLKGPKSK